MNSCCALYHIDPETLNQELVQIELDECRGCDCYCGYLQFESLAPYITKLTNNNTQNDDHNNLEAKLRQQIVEVSRLFDVETRSEPGTYSKAHYKIIKLYGDGTKYLKIPDFVEGTLELYTHNNYLIDPDSYIYKDGFLIFNPCELHTPTCGCTNTCGIYQVQRNSLGWNGCFQAKAKFGKECANDAVRLAIRMYMIELNSFGDAVETRFQGLVARPFKRPDAWDTLVKRYLADKEFLFQFSFA